MELYHLHLLNHQDKYYKVGNEFIVNDNNFNNRLYYKTMDLNPCVEVKRYQNLVTYLNYILVLNNYKTFDKLIPLNEVISMVQRQGCDEVTLKRLLEDCEKKMNSLVFFVREHALENYRKDNNIDAPSRLHSLFATHEDGIDFWKEQIVDGDLDIYRINVDDKVFVSNPCLLPDEDLTYAMAYQLSSRYFKPRQKELDNKTNEYLVQGKVKILEKVDEVRKRK